ncbi:hypothetical protein J5J86_16150 [Aquabacter sp. L1I39]|uniref:hypothetical protein n=1 Tax=Aquabacter sp. L1I39 TaxID=2820278 RepID=UPI001ADD4DA5|nr:hypothetical protein [Aquabacter sp. L1I39]QTL02323.1 hypothetical protein J5J86_16150 [Aquabacter sp. L1I39]
MNKTLPLLTAAALALTTFGAAAQSGIAPAPNTQTGPAQEGGRTNMTPGASGSGTVQRNDQAAQPTPHSGVKPGQNTQAGPAQQGGRTQASPGGSGGSTDTTGSVPATPRSGLAPAPDTHKGPAQEGGRTQATPGATR